MKKYIYIFEISIYPNKNSRNKRIGIYYHATRLRAKYAWTTEKSRMILFLVNFAMYFAGLIFTIIVTLVNPVYGPLEWIGEAIFLAIVSGSLFIFTFAYGFLVLRRLKGLIYDDDEKIILIKLRRLLAVCVTFCLLHSLGILSLIS